MSSSPQIIPLVLSFWKSALVNNGSCQWSEELTQKESCLCRLTSFLRVPVFWWIACSQSPQIGPVAPWHFFAQRDSSLPSNLLPVKPCVYIPGALTKPLISVQLVGQCHSWGYRGTTQETLVFCKLLDCTPHPDIWHLSQKGHLGTNRNKEMNWEQAIN